MKIKIVKDQITWLEVKKLAREGYGDMIKVVADIKLDILAMGGEMHADAEQLLLEHNSSQDDLWGFNIYPEATDDKMLEYVSFINIRPKLGNRSQEIDSEIIKNKIKSLVKTMII